MIALVLALGGCAAAEAQTAPTTPDTAELERARAARVAVERAQSRLRELEAELALSRAESDQLRDEVGTLRAEANQRSTTVSRQCASEPASTPEPEVVVAEAEPAPADAGPRPVLRLYGPAPSERPAMRTDVAAVPGPNAPSIVAPPPQGAARLPVYAMGTDPSDVPAIPVAPVAVAGQEPPPATAAPLVQPEDHDRATRQYRRALRSLSERRLRDAREGLARFVAEHPSHPYADNAMYWRAEILYTRRDYRGALRELSQLIERYPRGNKVPDALLRIGVCYERLGRRGSARRVFDRLRAQYPRSVAARQAAREDA